MSAFLRRRMRGLLRTTFSAPQSTDAICSSVATGDCEDAEEALLMMLDGQHRPSPGPSSSSSAQPVFERILNGKNVRKVQTVPEVYSGKTGLDLPNIHVAPLLLPVKACHTGPDGGLTRVQPMRQRAIAKMAKLDDEEFSLSSMDEDEENGEEIDENGEELDNVGNGQQKALNGARMGRGEKRLTNGKSLMQAANSMEALGFGPEDQQLKSRSQLERLDWSNCWDEHRAFGLSTSLYEKHPVTGLSAGHPIADVFGIIARQNNAVLALADGVNWGEGARLAARCAICGAMDHLNAAIERQQFQNTNDIFHSMLGAFHGAHALILQEGGALTTLCVALVAPVKDSNTSVLCVCNVGDSLCFVYNAAHGVREVTLGSHDIGQMRDMRDAGGALGPVDGRNPQLHNLTCSMTFVEDGDLVFITSDGISDNFDPVVGKFCVIRRQREDSSEKENDGAAGVVQTKSSTIVPTFHKTKSAPVTANMNVNQHQFHNGAAPPPPIRPMKRPPAATLPCVDALERHELMLLRMSDVIPNGLYPAMPSSSTNSLNTSSPSPSSKSPHPISAAELCRNLVQFAYQLSSAKRRTLEDPELYRTRTHSKTEERLRRKMIRNMIMEMPGKLDHASVVAYRVGSEWDDGEIGMFNGMEAPPPPYTNGTHAQQNGILIGEANGHEKSENDSNLDQCIDTKQARAKFFGTDNANGLNKKDTECQAGIEQVHFAANHPKMEIDNAGQQQENAQNSEEISKNSIAIQCSWRPPTAQSSRNGMGMPKTASPSERKAQMNLADLPVKKLPENQPIIAKQLPAKHTSQKEKQQQPRSPYEEMPIEFASDEVNGVELGDVVNNKEADGKVLQNGGNYGKKKSKHGRGSLARHTLGVDVTWLKRLVTSKHGSANINGMIVEEHMKIEAICENEVEIEQQGFNERRKKSDESAATSNSQDAKNSDSSSSPRITKKHRATANLRSMLGTVPSISSSALNNVSEKLNQTGAMPLRKIRAAFARQSSSQDSRRHAPMRESDAEKRLPMNAGNNRQIKSSVNMNANHRVGHQHERFSPNAPLPVVVKPAATNTNKLPNGMHGNGSIQLPSVPRMGMGQLKNNNAANPAVPQLVMAENDDAKIGDGLDSERQKFVAQTART